MDKFSAERHSANMRAIHSTDTKPEMVVRRFVHRMCSRNHLTARTCLESQTWFLVPAEKSSSCMDTWHQHSKSDCKLARRLKSNMNYWLPKLEPTVKRASEHHTALKNEGRDVLVRLECEVKKKEHLENQLQTFLE